MNRRRLALGLGLCAVANAVVVACSGGQTSHVFQGHHYLEDRDCYESLTALDVLEGPDPGLTCDAICLVGTSPLIEDGGSAVYVTNMCPPYPPTMQQPTDTPRCRAALAALDRGDRCLDTGSANPLRDAGPDATDDAAAPDAAAAAPDATATPEDDASTLDDASTSDAAPADDASVQDADIPEDAGS